MKILQIALLSLLVAQSVQAVHCPCGRPDELPVVQNVQREQHQIPDRSNYNMELTAQCKRYVKAFCNKHAGKLTVATLATVTALAIYNRAALAKFVSEKSSSLLAKFNF